MSEARSPREVLHRARELLDSVQVGDGSVRQRESLGTPLIVSHPSGAPYSWLVPVILENHLVGYLQLDLELEMIRYASFQRRPDSLEGVPEALDWLDPDRVLQRAAAVAAPNEDLGKPVLTYDRYPDRLAWRVKARSANGTIRNIMVAGGAAWEQADLGDMVGGPGDP